MDNDMQKCRRCHKNLDITFFDEYTHKNKPNLIKHFTTCSSCRNI